MQSVGILPQHDQMSALSSLKSYQQQQYDFNRALHGRGARGLLRERRELHAVYVKEVAEAFEKLTGENSLMEDILDEPHSMQTNNLVNVMSHVLQNPDGSANSAILQHRRPPRFETVQKVGALLGLRRQALLNRRSLINSSRRKSLVDYRTCGDDIEENEPHSKRSSNSNMNSKSRPLEAGVQDQISSDPVRSDNQAKYPPHTHKIRTGKVNYRVMLEEQARMRDHVKTTQPAYEEKINSMIGWQRDLETRFTGFC